MLTLAGGSGWGAIGEEISEVGRGSRLDQGWECEEISMTIKAGHQPPLRFFWSVTLLAGLPQRKTNDVPSSDPLKFYSTWSCILSGVSSGILCRYLLVVYLANLLSGILSCPFYLAYLPAFYLVYILAFYLAYILAFYVAFFLAYILAFYVAFYVAYILAV